MILFELSSKINLEEDWYYTMLISGGVFAVITIGWGFILRFLLFVVLLRNYCHPHF